MDFIHALENNPRIADSSLDTYTVHRLHHPLTSLPTMSPDEHLSIKLYLAGTSDGAEKIYNETRKAILERHPEDNILTLYQVRRIVSSVSNNFLMLGL